eukprot:763351-Hanusia_phi.AAC.1
MGWQDLEAYKTYLDALVQRKALLSQFGGDAAGQVTSATVRGITARQRIENTSSRVGEYTIAQLVVAHVEIPSGYLAGLKLPKYNVEEEDLADYGKRLGLKEYFSSLISPSSREARRPRVSSAPLHVQQQRSVHQTLDQRVGAVESLAAALAAALDEDLVVEHVAGRAVVMLRPGGEGLSVDVLEVDGVVVVVDGRLEEKLGGRGGD